MEKDNLDLEELKQKYAVFREKYDLPGFSELNVFFDIEDLEDCETEFFLRKIRKLISERIAGFLRFFEIILNPMSGNVPAFFFKLVKKLDSKDKEILSKIYEQLGNLEIEVVRLDLDYAEEKEAEFIKKIFSFFSEIKGDVLKIVNKMVNSGDRGFKRESGSYFG